MIRSVILMIIVIVFFSAIGVNAQDSWPVVQNCLGELTYPMITQGNWDFPGVIISSVFRDGVRGIRADQNMDYYIALESDDTFPGGGALSPDGRYFAYPIGYSNHNVNSSGDETILNVDYIRIVRTDGNTDETYRFAVNNYAFAGSSGSLAVGSPTWLDNEWVYYEDLGGTSRRIHNFQSGETREMPEGVYWPVYVSPDSRRGFSDSYPDPAALYDLETGANLAYPLPWGIAWFRDSSAFIASNEGEMAIVDRDGQRVETIGSQTAW
ncbi:MAG: hypothetical protein K8I60_16550, partial [Anaerolineae bacterium]|nr:hypothetical protein [Anaerolineae bacterium]